MVGWRPGSIQCTDTKRPGTSWGGLPPNSWVGLPSSRRSRSGAPATLTLVLMLSWLTKNMGGYIVIFLELQQTWLFTSSTVSTGKMHIKDKCRSLYLLLTFISKCYLILFFLWIQSSSPSEGPFLVLFIYFFEASLNWFVLEEIHVSQVITVSLEGRGWKSTCCCSCVWVLKGPVPGGLCAQASWGRRLGAGDPGLLC